MARADVSVRNGTLTPAETDKLHRLEQTIEHGMVTFVAVGGALAEIREERLYRAEHETFETYCRERWSIGASRARQLIGAADVVQSVTRVTQNEHNPSLSPPANERTARALSTVPPTERAEVWKEAVETAPNGKVTAEHVRETVEKLKQPAPIMNPDQPGVLHQDGVTYRNAVRRPVDSRIRALVSAALDMRDISDRDLSALVTNDTMIEGLEQAIQQVDRIVSLHNTGVPHAND